MREMQLRPLGQSGLQLSQLCLGTMMFGGQTQEAEARAIIDHAADRGINFIDTADVYNEGRSEEVTGRAIKQRRAHWVLATKVGSAIPGKREPEGGLARDYVMRSAEGSLKRLGLDHIDIYYVHRPDPRTPWEDAVASFGALIRSGKIRHWGLSNVRGWHIATIAHLCRVQGVPPPVVIQPYYNVLNRMPEVEVLPAAKHFGVGVTPFSPLARGILSGKYAPGAAPPADSRVARQDKRVMETEWRPESLEIAARLQAHAAARGGSLIDYAVAWVLNNAAVTSVIAGPRTLAQWESYAGALAYRWTAEDEALADELVPPGHPSTPGYTDPNFPVDGRFASRESEDGAR